MPSIEEDPLGERLSVERLVQLDSRIQTWLADHYLVASSLGLPGVSVLSFSGGFLFGKEKQP